jgi:hypothetical protein
MYPAVHEGYRRSLIRRFPYAVFYEESEAAVTIYAVFSYVSRPGQLAPAPSVMRCVGTSDQRAPSRCARLYWRHPWSTHAEPQQAREVRAGILKARLGF